MKNLSKFMIILLCIIVFMILIAGIYVAIIWNNSNKIELEKSKLLSPFSNLTIYDYNDKEIENIKSSYQRVSFEELNSSTIDAFTSIEDKRFFEHNGVDIYRIAGAIYNNIKSYSLKEGASTITQQLVKNTLLTNEKTLDRKITELFLSQKLEKEYTKQEILSMYLSAIYFGNGQYGIKNASKFYFDKELADLTISESALLAGMIKSPTKYCPITNYDNAIKRRNVVLRKMLENFKISSDEFNKAISEKNVIMQNISKNTSFYNYVVLEACEKLNLTEIELFSGNYIIYTNFNESYNTILDEAAKISDYPTTSILLDNKTHTIISTFESKTKNSLYKKDNPASLIKPILVYSIAVNENIISPLTIFEDVKTSWNGFSPSNSGDLYYGNVSMRTAIEKSLNIPAIKAFNSIPNKVLQSYAKKMNINISEDENLTFAVGGIKDGLSVIQLAGGFSTLANYGEFSTPSFITKIENSKNEVQYRKSFENETVFSSETSFIINDMLKSVAKTGTAKTLNRKFHLENVGAKTGTNGTSNGNSECYSVVYNEKYTLITKIARNNELLPNSISGGTLPTEINGKIFSQLKSFESNFDETELNLKKVDVDLYTLIADKKAMLASPNTPKKYIISEYIASQFAPKIESTAFEKPFIQNFETSESNDLLTIKIDTSEIYDYEISNSENDESNFLSGNGEQQEISFPLPNVEKINFEIIPISKFNPNIRGDAVLTKTFYKKFTLIP